MAPVSSYQIRKIIIEQSKRAGVGHIGSALSIADLVSALYGHLLNVTDPDDPDRDRVILSKGHAVLALYAAFFLKGWITEAELNTYLCRREFARCSPGTYPARCRLFVQALWDRGYR